MVWGLAPHKIHSLVGCSSVVAIGRVGILAISPAFVAQWCTPIRRFWMGGGPKSPQAVVWRVMPGKYPARVVGSYSKVGYTVARGCRLASLGCLEVRTGCHFGDWNRLGYESAIQRVRKDDRENRGQQIGVHEKRAIRVESVDFH